MTPLADRSTGEQWPELEPCACGQSALTQETPRNYRAYCDSIPGKLVCMREVFGKSKTEAAAAWNAMQRVARGVDVVTIEFPDAESRHRWDHMGDNPCDDKACAICYVQPGEVYSP